MVVLLLSKEFRDMPIAFRQYFRTVGRAALVIAFAIASAFSQSQHVSEFDPTVWIGYDVNNRVRLDLVMGREESDDIGSAKWKVTVGASFRFRSAFPTLLEMIDSDKHHVLVIGTYYQYSRGTDATGTTVEHRAIFDVTGRYAIKNFLVTDRNRIEFRSVNGDFRFRYRNLAILERPFRVRGYRIAPFVTAEAFWDKDLGKWNQFRFSGGSNFALYRRSSVDVYFERAHCVSCSYTNTNVAGLRFYIFFRRKK